MVVISSAIVVITAVSLYDYFSARSWNQVTSSSRNNVVFEKRNQKYGAYQIRRDYDRRIVLILFIFCSTIGLSYWSYLYLRPPLQHSIPTVDDPNVIVDIDVPPAEDDKSKVEEPKPEKPDQPEDAGSKSQEATTTFVEMEIEDDPTENTSALVEVLQDTKAATTTTTGGSGFPGDGPGDGPGDDNGGGDPFDPKIPVKDPDTPAEYIGGTEARTNFLVSNLHPPSDNFEKTTISVQFVVDENGEISLAKVASKSINCQQCEEEALRVIRKMPRWKPAIKNNKKVASFFKISIVFETE